MSYADYELYKAHHLIVESRGWDYWGYNKGKSVVVPGLGTVEVVHTLEDTRTRHYDEFDQGSTSPAGLIFRVTYEDGAVHHFQKEGTYDSYGGVEYSGSFFEVATVEKTVVTYEATHRVRRA